MRCLSPESSSIYGARCTRALYGVALEAYVELQNQAEGQISLQYSSKSSFEIQMVLEKIGHL
jgi:hypothetical protein